MSEEQKQKRDELLTSVDVSRRNLLKRLMVALPAVYVAPVVASFSMSTQYPVHHKGCHGSNMSGGNMTWG